MGTEITPDSVPERPDQSSAQVKAQTPDLQPFRNLALRWKREAQRHWEMIKDLERGTPFYRSCFQRYVDYGRRAEELEIIIRMVEKPETESILCNHPRLIPRYPCADCAKNNPIYSGKAAKTNG